jgi:alpha-N-arabinofuranosidase
MEMNGAGKEAPHLIEEVYNLEDALVVASYLNSFIRHADVLKVANLAQIVNIIAPILTEKDHLVLQTIYHPLAMVAKRRQGLALRCSVEGPHYEVKDLPPVSFVDASALLDGKLLTVFAVNRHQREAQTLEVAVADRRVLKFVSGEQFSGADPKAVNTRARQNIAPQALAAPQIGDGRATLSLPPLSFSALSLELA